MDAFTAICILLLTLSFIYYLNRSKVKYVYPPGPKGWPIIGNALDVSSTHLHLSLTEIGKDFGDIFSVNLLGQRVVVLNSVKAVRDALITEDNGAAFAGRPLSFLGKYTDDNCSSTTFMPSSKTWQKLRKIVHRTLNMYGDGIQEAENNILEEISHVIKWIEARDGQDVDLYDVIVPSLSNIMSYLLIGRRFDYESPELRTAMDIAFGVNEMGTAGIDALLSRLPVLRFLPFSYGSMYRRYMAVIEEFYKYYYHPQKASHNPDVTRGLIDVLLSTQEDLQAKGEHSLLTDENVRSAMKDTIQAGTLTTKGALMSFFLMIAHNPHVAKRIQQEIDREVGGDRYPSLKDRPDMPYTEAAILEIVRFVTPVPLAIPHCTIAEKRYQGYFLPKETLVLPNYWGIHHDEGLWEKPFEFRPERFLDESGKMLPLDHPTRKNILAFSAGKRSCPGENFAKSRMFLYLTALLQKFNFRPIDGVTLPPCDPRQFCHGIVLYPERFKLRIEARS